MVNQDMHFEKSQECKVRHSQREENKNHSGLEGRMPWCIRWGWRVIRSDSQYSIRGLHSYSGDALEHVHLGTCQTQRRMVRHGDRNPLFEKQHQIVIVETGTLGWVTVRFALMCLFLWWEQGRGGGEKVSSSSSSSSSSSPEGQCQVCLFLSFCSAGDWALGPHGKCSTSELYPQT